MWQWFESYIGPVTLVAKLYIIYLYNTRPRPVSVVICLTWVSAISPCVAWVESCGGPVTLVMKCYTTQAVKKQEKTILASEEALKSAELKTVAQLKQVAVNASTPHIIASTPFVQTMKKH